MRDRFTDYNEIASRLLLDDFKKVRLTDDEVREEIIKVIDKFDIAEIKALPKLQSDKIVAEIKKINGITQRQISRILGIPLTLISKA